MRTDVAGFHSCRASGSRRSMTNSASESATSAIPGNLSKRAGAVFDFAQEQVKALTERDPGFYPMFTENGKWRHDKPAWTRWCDGFLPGMMWLFLESGTADDPSYWRKKAEEYSSRLEDSK